MNKHSEIFLNNIKTISDQININDINNLANQLKKLREKKGRIFFLGVGGSAANSSHAVNDFRKLCNIESYSITDNVSELTARINDEGWDTSLEEWLKVSNLSKDDAIFVLEENIRGLKKDFENVKLEHDYLSSTEKLLEFQNLYFDDELVKKEIDEIKIIIKKSNKLQIQQLKFINEK